MALDLKPNVLTGAGCTLDAAGYARQRDRVERLVDDFVATEGVCCSFLSLGSVFSGSAA